MTAALSESEESYRTLCDSIDDGFCLIEVRCDDTARPIDYSFLDVNPAFERQTGLVDAPATRYAILSPSMSSMDSISMKVALSGQSTRFALLAQPVNGRWYEVFAYRVGEPDEWLVAILFSDVIEQRSGETRLKAREQNLRPTSATLWSSEANLRLLLNTISESFYAVDRDDVTAGRYCCSSATIGATWTMPASSRVSPQRSSP